MGSRQTTPDLTLSEVNKLVNGAREKLYADIDSLTDWAIEEIENRQGVNGQTVYESTLDVLKELSPSVNKLTDDYYDTVRTIWKQHGVQMHDMSHADKVDFARTIWKMAGGTNNTDYPGYTFKQVVEGKAPVRIENLIPQIGSQDDLEQFIGDYIQQHARLSIRDNIENDPTRPRWARIPRGAKTCAFCMMLSSRGFVYHSDESAGAGMNIYHAHCDCQIVPQWGEQEARINGWDPERYKEIYLQAKSSAGKGSNYKTVLSYMRREHPTVLKDGVFELRKDQRMPKNRSAFDIERKFSGMRDQNNVSEAEWDARQEALGIPVRYDILEPHEIVFMERFKALGYHFEWIPKDEKNFSSTNDFYWGELGKEVELKSTFSKKPKYSTESEKIRKAVKKSVTTKQNENGKRKTSFILDYYGTASIKKVISQLQKYNQRNPEYQIADLWYADNKGIHRIEQNK